LGARNTSMDMAKMTEAQKTATPLAMALEDLRANN
jgi:hypothetical protein